MSGVAPGPGARTILMLVGVWLAAPSEAQTLPAVPVPAENPITEEKRVLGKTLFWEEQLSSDDSVACGTCHAPGAGGADARLGIHPGADEIFDTADDVVGSPGVVRRASNGARVSDPLFGFDPQVTSRAAPSFFGGLWAPENFWDGRADGAFDDPLTGTPLIASGGALENQALAPILSDVEMAAEGRTWAAVTAKLETVTPLVFAADLPADVAAALAGGSSYGDLFEDAFGDSAITPARIAFAIATYERTLVADQTPWDDFIAGDTGALTADQQAGWNAFQATACATCHVPPTFSNDEFRNVGVRPPGEDTGREAVTGAPDDLGRFKTPTLRNTGLKPTFMHNGGITSIEDVLGFYQPGQSFPANRDPLVPVAIDPIQQTRISDFIENGLIDPRVAAETFPFDRPFINAAGAAGVFVPALGAGMTGMLSAILMGIGALRLRRLGVRGSPRGGG